MGGLVSTVNPLNLSFQSMYGEPVNFVNYMLMNLIQVYSFGPQICHVQS